MGVLRGMQEGKGRLQEGKEGWEGGLQEGKEGWEGGRDWRIGVFR